VGGKTSGSSKIRLEKRLRDIIPILKKKGSLTRAEVLRMGVPKKTFYRICDFLSETGLAYYKDETLYWVEYNKPVESMSDSEYQIKMRHSIEILPGLFYYYESKLKNLLKECEKERIESLRDFLISISDLVKGNPSISPSLQRYIESHLKTGYRSLYEKIQSLITQSTRGNHELLNEVLKELNDIIHSVKSGEPLKGMCDSCPSVKINQGLKFEE